MKLHNQGAFYRITVGADDIASFADQWPCSGLRGCRGLSFTFDSRNGDLVDSNDAERAPHADGSAIRALAQDAQTYGLRRLGRPATPTP